RIHRIFLQRTSILAGSPGILAHSLHILATTALFLAEHPTFLADTHYILAEHIHSCKSTRYSCNLTSYSCDNSPFSCTPHYLTQLRARPFPPRNRNPRAKQSHHPIKKSFRYYESSNCYLCFLCP